MSSVPTSSSKVTMAILSNLVVVLIANLFVINGSAGVANRGNSVSAVTWYVSQNICSMLGCSCAEVNSSHKLVTCTCHDKNQVVNLERGTEQQFQSSLSFKIENCQHLKIHPYAFAPLSGSHFDLVLTNIGQLDVMESAFDFNANAQTNSRDVIFNNVSVDVLPPKSFPSSLNILKILNSQIRHISTLAFKGKTLQELVFQNSRITSIQPKAFDEEILINNSWTVDNCEIGQIENQGIASSITNLTWVNSTIGNLHPYSLSGIIPSATFRQNIFQKVQTNGLTLKDWTEVTFRNNSFDLVEPGGLDLTQHSEEFNVTLFQDNEWGVVGTDFIKVGFNSDTPFTIILNNQILQPCNCSTLKLFIPQVTLEGSSAWFQEQLWNNSQCLTTPEESACLGRSDPAQTLLSYSEFPELCSEAVFLCLNEISIVHETTEDDVTHTPPLTGKLRILFIIVGTVAVAIVLALILVICVYMCRRDKGRPEKVELGQPITPRSHSNSNPTSRPPHHPYSGFYGAGAKMREGTPSRVPDSGPLFRPRSTLFEDVEMEDKGVQTLPGDIPREALESLRDKLTDPGSFWDAKETIDHLYDHIHVREDKTSVASPPDVTVLPKVNGSVSKTSNPTQRLIAPTTHYPPIRSSSLVPSGQGQPAGPVPRYAQIRSKPIRPLVICQEYGSPSTEFSNVYSELHRRGSQVNGRPQVCDYTEPQDVQAHVYAELSSFPTVPTGVACNPNHHNKTFCVQRPRPIGRITTPPIVPVFAPNSENCPATSPAGQQRPLPSIPPPFSTSTLK